MLRPSAAEYSIADISPPVEFPARNPGDEGDTAIFKDVGGSRPPTFDVDFRLGTAPSQESERPAW